MVYNYNYITCIIIYIISIIQLILNTLINIIFQFESFDINNSYSLRYSFSHSFILILFLVSLFLLFFFCNYFLFHNFIFFVEISHFNIFVICCLQYISFTIFSLTMLENYSKYLNFIKYISFNCMFNEFKHAFFEIIINYLFEIFKSIEIISLIHLRLIFYQLNSKMVFQYFNCSFNILSIIINFSIKISAEIRSYHYSVKSFHSKNIISFVIWVDNIQNIEWLFKIFNEHLKYLHVKQ